MTTGAILVVTILPLALGRCFAVFVPPEFEALTIVFVFASLFLDEVGGYYTRFWWWDAALHTASGFLVGILGFLLVYVMNAKEELDLHMNPGRASSPFSPSWSQWGWDRSGRSSSSPWTASSG